MGELSLSLKSLLIPISEIMCLVFLYFYFYAYNNFIEECFIPESLPILSVQTRSATSLILKVT